MTEELKPCPFCGNKKPQTWWDWTTPKGKNEGFNIICNQCEQACVNRIYKHEAIQAWNGRANDKT